MMQLLVKRPNAAARAALRLRRTFSAAANNGPYSSSAPATTSTPVKRITIPSLRQKATKGVPISVLTAYDAPTAAAMAESVDVILVGDSVGMVVLGWPSTVQVTMEDMVHHSAAVSRSVHRPVLVSDMPFGSYTTASAAVTNAVRLVQAGGVHSVKLEGGKPQAAKIGAIVAEGIPVMAHCGLLPQTALLNSGYSVRGRTADAALSLIEDCLAVQAAGAWSVVIEMVPAQVTAYLTGLLRIPTIGIGAGPHAAGQVLVAHDLLRMHPAQPPRFVKQYADVGSIMRTAFKQYAEDVHGRRFPGGSVSSSDHMSRFLQEQQELQQQRIEHTRAQPQQHFTDMRMDDLKAFHAAVSKHYPQERAALSALEAAAADLQKRLVPSAATGATFTPPPPPPPPAAAPPAAPAPAAAPVASPKQQHRSSIVLPSATTPTSGADLKVAILGGGAIARLFAAHIGAAAATTGAAVHMWSAFAHDAHTQQQQSSSPTVAYRPYSAAGTASSDVQQVAVAGLHDPRSFAPLHSLPPLPTPPPSPSVSAAAIEAAAGEIGSYDAVFLCGKAATGAVAQTDLAWLLAKPRTGAILPLYNGAYTFEHARVRIQQLQEHLVRCSDVHPALAAHLRDVGDWQLGYGATANGALLSSSSSSTSAGAAGAGAYVVTHTGLGPTHFTFPLTSSAEGQAAAATAMLTRLLSPSLGGTAVPPHQWQQYRWAKLAVNAVLNPTVALLNAPNGAFLDVLQPRSDGSGSSGSSKAAAVAAREHVQLLADGVCSAWRLACGKRDPSTLLTDAFASSPGVDLPGWNYVRDGRDLLAKVAAVAAATAGNTCSLLTDIRSARLCEVDLINGAVLHQSMGLHPALVLPPGRPTPQGLVEEGLNSWRVRDSADPGTAAHSAVWQAVAAREQVLGIRTKAALQQCVLPLLHSYQQAQREAEKVYDQQLADAAVL